MYLFCGMANWCSDHSGFECMTAEMMQLLQQFQCAHSFRTAPKSGAIGPHSKMSLNAFVAESIRARVVKEL
jgi:hypothetical protein